METRLRDICAAVRSKQAGPYRLTLDIVFQTPELYHAVKARQLFQPAQIAALYHLAEDQITRCVYYDPGWAVKISMIRPRVAGDPGDGDVYGCQQHAPLLDMVINLPDNVFVGGSV